MRFRKKFNILMFGFLLTITPLFGDDFTDLIQDLAIQTACLGQYSATQAHGGWYQDPKDYYTAPMMAERFRRMSGEMTRTQTFYGICFDYAQAAWDDIKQYQKLYNDVGMLNQQWYIAAVKDNPNIITLYDPIPSDRVLKKGNNYVDKNDGKTLEKWNGVYCKKKTEYKVTSHSSATWHAWLWVQRKNGTWYWLDPTWTDNTGYVWWGYVNSDKEIQLKPDEKFCLVLPSEWFPRQTQEKTESNNTNNSNSTQNTTNNNSHTTNPSVTTNTNDKKTVLSTYCFLGYIGNLDFLNNDGISYFNSDRYGIEFSVESFALKGQPFAMFAVDFCHIDNDKSATLFGWSFGYALFDFFQPYFGGEVGITYGEDIGFAWKIDCGFRISIIYGIFILRTGISYSNIMKCSGTIALGVMY